MSAPAAASRALRLDALRLNLSLESEVLPPSRRSSGFRGREQMHGPITASKALPNGPDKNEGLRMKG